MNVILLRAWFFKRQFLKTVDLILLSHWFYHGMVSLGEILAPLKTMTKLPLTSVWPGFHPLTSVELFIITIGGSEERISILVTCIIFGLRSLLLQGGYSQRIAFCYVLCEAQQFITVLKCNIRFVFQVQRLSRPSSFPGTLWLHIAILACLSSTVGFYYCI